MAADDRATGVDEGWEEGAAKPPSAQPRPENEKPADADSADTIDTAKSRVVRLVEGPVRVDSDDGKPPSARSERTVPPPADYDVVRKTSKNRAFDLDAALQREAKTKVPAVPPLREPAAPTAPAPAALRGAEPPTPAIPAPAPVPAALDLPAPAEADQTAEVTSDVPEESASDEPPYEDGSLEEPAADVPARGRGAVMIGGATVLAVALVAGAFALRSTREQETAKNTVAPSASSSSVVASPVVASASPSATPAPPSIDSAPSPTLAASAPQSAPAVGAPTIAATHSAPARGSSSAPVASTATAASIAPVASSASVTSATPAASAPSPKPIATASAKGAPGIEFLKRDL
jgi:hypothetical protein